MRPTFKLKTVLNNHEARAAKHNLSGSYAQTWSIQDLLSFANRDLQEFASLQLGYPEIYGGLKLREKISNLVGEIPAENVMITNGADEAISITLSALSQHLRRVIIQQPAYPGFAGYSQLSHLEIVEWHLNSGSKWSASMDQFRTLLADQPSIVLLSIPNNPTGWFPSDEEMAELTLSVRNSNSVLVIDEVYAGLKKGETPFWDSSKLQCDHVRIGSMSKTFGLAGLRMGWIAVNQSALVRDIQSVRNFSNSYVSTPVEYFSGIALEHYKEILSRNFKITQKNRRLLEAFLSEHPDRFGATLPEDGAVAFIEWKGKESAQSVTERLLRDHQILLVNGDSFDSLPNYFRFGFGTLAFQASLEALERVMDNGFL